MKAGDKKLALNDARRAVRRALLVLGALLVLVFYELGVTLSASFSRALVGFRSRCIMVSSLKDKA